MKRLLFPAGILILLFPHLLAAQNQRTVLAQIETAYKQFEYEKVDSLAGLALANYHRYSVKDLVWIHLYLGSAKFAQGYQTESRRQFSAALSLNPDLELDPAFFSPKIIQVFREVKKEVNRNQGPRAGGPVRYLIQPDVRLNAAWRSMLLPGWGQMYKKDNTKGKIILGAVVLDAAAIAILHWQVTRAHDRYLAARNPDDIEKKFSTYRNWYRLRNGCILAGIATWLYSYFDALYQPIPAHRVSLGLSPSFSAAIPHTLTVAVWF